MTRDELLKELESGRFATVIFTKKNGEVRKLTGRMGVKKALRGGQKAYDDASKGIVTIYDSQKKAYRSIKVESISEVHANGKRIVVKK